MARRAGAVAVLLAALAGCGGSGPDLEVVDVAAPAGVADTVETQGETCVADLDGDGLLDLVLSGHNGPWRFVRGTPGGRFEELVALPKRDRHGCAVADFDGDGRLDVYLSVGACRGTCENPMELWLQRPDGTFVDRAAAWGVDDPQGRGRVPVVLDADGDGRPDLFVGQEVGAEHPSPNRLWLNRGARFEAATDPVATEVGGHCAAVADVDGDGLDDLAVCETERGFALYRNEGGRFVDATGEAELERYGRRNVEFADVDDDGRPDLVTVTERRVQVHRNLGGRFSRPTFDVELTDGRDVAVADFDGDGHVDLYVQQGSGSDVPDHVWLGDGTGTFSAGYDLPGTAGTAGDRVTAIPDWQGTGRAAFLVNNGHRQAGTRQLFVLRPRRG